MAAKQRLLLRTFYMMTGIAFWVTSLWWRRCSIASATAGATPSISMVHPCESPKFNPGLLRKGTGSCPEPVFLFSGVLESGEFQIMFSILF